MNPVDWEPVDAGGLVDAACAAASARSGVRSPCTNAVAERFDLELDRRADVMHRALNKIDREQMIASANTMIAALRHNLIDAADFAR